MPARTPEEADLVVVNTCAFIEEAREESIETILALSDRRKPGARLVVTGCLAERYAEELADALPEVDEVAPFGVAFDGIVPPATVTVPITVRSRRRVPDFDLLTLPRPPAEAPWAYVKIAEGCDRSCSFCAIPSFRGPQRSRSVEEILAEVESLSVREVILVAQDLASFGRDHGCGQRRLVPLLEQVRTMVDRVRCLYLYPSDVTDELIEAICRTGVAYFDLSLQHVSRPLLRSMRRWGDGERFRDLVARIRSAEPEAAIRSSFIVGHPGETETDHVELLDFLREVELDWVGFFPYSEEEGTRSAELEPKVPREVALERIRELSEVQDRITMMRRERLVGRRERVLVDAPGVARTWREAPEIDGVVEVPPGLEVGSFVEVDLVATAGMDLIGEPVDRAGAGVVAAGG